MIYLDYAANTPVSDQVLQVFNEATKNAIANPNASHTLGKKTKQEVEKSTQIIADLLGIKPEEVIYTSGATEANNLAIKGICGQYKRYGKHIITTYLEHSSVTSPVAALQKQGYEVDFVELMPTGEVDLEHLKSLLREDTLLVSISYVDSELGIVQPVEAISECIKTVPNCFFHVDATQAVGKIPVNFDGIDLLSFAPHKFHGLNGIGILIKKSGIFLEPVIHGGVSTTIFRSGTPTVGLIASAEVALKEALATLDAHYEKVSQLSEKLKVELMKYPQVQLNSTTKSSAYMLNISLQNKRAVAVQEALSEREIYIATKSACCTLNTPSRPVYALTKDKKRAMQTLRISLSHLTTEEEIQLFLKAFEDIMKNQ